MCTWAEHAAPAYLCSGVSEEETAGPVAGKDKGRWTKGRLERGRVAASEAAHVFLACPSWKHICPTSAADWSPRHCRHRNQSAASPGRTVDEEMAEKHSPPISGCRKERWISAKTGERVETHAHTHTGECVRG